MEPLTVNMELLHIYHVIVGSMVGLGYHCKNWVLFVLKYDKQSQALILSQEEDQCWVSFVLKKAVLTNALIIERHPFRSIPPDHVCVLLVMHFAKY